MAKTISNKRFTVRFKQAVGTPAEKKERAEDEELVEELPTITIDTVENDDWMKALPGYKNERAIHEQLAKKYRGKKVGNKLIVSRPKE